MKLSTLNPRILFSLLAVFVSGISGLKIPRHATLVSRETALKTSYDFVIAGGGISGLTVADRLTEDAQVNVLVIEAGPLDQGEDSVLIPGAFPPFQYWTLDLICQPQAELNNRSAPAISGRVVGGGSAVNAMVFLRSHMREYDDWQELGATGWDWDGLLPFFKKSENFTVPDDQFAKLANISFIKSVHGTKGPVHNTYPNYFFPGSANFWNAALSLGFKPTPDPNGGTLNGLFFSPSAIDATTMTRSYARLAHYDRVKNSRSNYHLLTEHSVARVIFDKKRAVGVEYLPSSGGDIVRVNASREIILAAGAMRTPQILQLSGVGPAKMLQRFNISLVADLPGVGANLQNQAEIEVPYTYSLSTNQTYNAEQRALYDTARKGAYTITRGLSTNIALAALRDAAPDYKTIIAAGRKLDPAALLPPGTDPSVIRGYAAQRAVIFRQLASDQYPVGMLHWSTGNSNRIFFLKPLSRGTISLNSTDPLAHPLIDWRSHTDPTDWAVSIAVLRKNRQLMNAPPIKILGPTEAAPLGEQLQTDEELREALRGLIDPGGSGHPCCTAAMMPRELGGVVDEKMRVYGVSGLRVVDISYWPLSLAAAPSATAYAGAEKIADMIKRELGLGEYRKQRV